MESPQYQVEPKVQVASNQPSTANGYSFPPLYSNVLVERTREVQAFQQTSGNQPRVYQRNTRYTEPLNTSIPLNNFHTPSNPNATNTPTAPRDSPKYRQQNIQSNGTRPENTSQVEQRQPTIPQPEPTQAQTEDRPKEELKRLSSFVLEEFKKIKVSLPLIELMKVSETRETLLGSLIETVAPRTPPQNTTN